MEVIDVFEGLKVGEIVRKNPKAAEVFANLGIDFCCGGNVGFQQVCDKKGLDSSVIWKEIESKSLSGNQASLDFDGFELDFLADYIVNVHHQFLYKNLPEVRYFVDKVYHKHQERFAYLTELFELYNEMEADLVAHLPKEENVLFPYIKQLVEGLRTHNLPATLGFGTVNNPIHVMLSEHDEVGSILHRMREITSNYTAPEDACNSHLVMIDKLKDLDQDLIQHIHLENNILFPKVIALEERFLQNN